jgi:hypothetical protein
MKHYRVSIDVDIKARHRAEAESRAQLLYGDMDRCRPWIIEILPNGIQERLPLNTRKGG